MKASLVSRMVLIGTLAVGSAAAFGKTISFNQLPAPVQREAQTELKNGPVKKVESLDQNGRTIYALTFQRPDGSNKLIYLNADGSYVQDQSLRSKSTSSPAPESRRLEMSQLPDAVQRTVQTELKNGPVSRIEEVTTNGKVMYQVTFNKSDGTDKVIYLNGDGTYVQNNTPTTASSRIRHSWDALTRSPKGSGALVGSRTVDFGSLPTAVQNAFRTEAGASGIQNIQEGQLNGQTVYQAAINRNGQNLQVRVDSGGYILSTMPLQSSFVNPQP